jgi:hypothetical protein
MPTSLARTAEIQQEKLISSNLRGDGSSTDSTPAGLRDESEFKRRVVVVGVADIRFKQNIGGRL